MTRSVLVNTIWSPMFAVVGFGMKAFEPNEPTILMITCIGVGTAGSPTGGGITGSSNARNRPAVGDDVVFCEFKVEGDDGRWLPLQPQVAVKQATTSAGSASFMRISMDRAR